MEIDNKKCKSCLYHGYISNETVCCLYIAYEHKRRNCPGGSKCDKYKKTNAKEVWRLKHDTHSSVMGYKVKSRYEEEEERKLYE